MTLEKAEIISLGIDWFTGTITTSLDKISDDAKLQLRVAQWSRIATQLFGQGEAKAWDALGYLGWQVDGFKFGTNLHGAIVVLSSDLAGEYWSHFYPAATNVTRLDVQVTAQFSKDLPSLAKDEAIKADLHRQNGGHAFKIRHLNGHGDGDTLYLGSRKSEAISRLYDKMRESGLPEYENSWRYEVEFKKDSAKQVAAHLHDNRGDNLALLALIVKEYGRHGIKVPFDLDASLFHVKHVKVKTDLDRSLMWLASDVAPTIKRLIEAGRHKDLFKALDLEAFLV